MSPPTDTATDPISKSADALIKTGSKASTPPPEGTPPPTTAPEPTTPTPEQAQTFDEGSMPALDESSGVAPQGSTVVSASTEVACS